MSHNADTESVLRDQIRRLEADLENTRVAAEAALSAKAAFLANISHELRTPLNAIIGYAEMLAEEMPQAGLETFEPDIAKILTAGRNLLAIINDVLDLSRIEAGRTEIVIEEFDPKVVVVEASSALKPQIESNGNLLEITSNEPVRMRSDAGRVRQILVNLLSNAAKFTQNGTIRVRITPEVLNGVPFVHFEIKDTGIGIAEEQLASLFHPFVQGDASARKKYKGTGLGLVLTHRISLLLGGDVSVESAPGTGSTFTVRLPQQLGGPELTARPEVPGTRVKAVSGVFNLPENFGKKGAGTPVVLVVDDDPAMRDLMIRNLGKDGIGVVTAWSGSEGLRLAKILRPRCVILDVLMPRMDGWNVLTELRKDPAIGSLPVIMTTVLDDRSQYIQRGANAFIRKPVDWVQMLKVVRELAPDLPAGRGA
ncbi:MAG: ATP-binding protein [Thermoanaerobaculia bacterium]|nr:ATP-binding protein [Thermoanaerobaculia bacterium]